MTENERNFAKFRKQLESLYFDIDESAKRVVSQMANVGMATTKKNTPVSGYETHTTSKGKKTYRRKKGAVIGGTLRKNWKRIATYRSRNGYSSGYSNNTDYGLFVNNGHRVVNKEGATVGYVKGERMLEQGINEARRQTETLFNQEIARVKRKGGW